MKEKNVQAVKHLKALPDPPKEALNDLESLFREHHEQIFRAAYRVTGSAVDAEDVLQTVFLRLARRAEGSFDLSPSPGSYFHRAAINASLDLMRGRMRQKSVSFADVEGSLVAGPASHPGSQHDDRELRRMIQLAIARLNPKMAEIFLLRYFEGYENREIAEMLGTSQVVVAVYLHRARTRLRQDMVRKEIAVGGIS